MANNWNSILSNTNSLTDVLTILKKVLALLEVKADVTTIDEALTHIEQLNIDVGSAVESVDTALEKLQLEADDVIAQGFYKSYATEVLLKSDTPNIAEMRARADDTRKIWRWTRTSTEGVTPVVGTWVDTGLSDKDLAINYTKSEIDPIKVKTAQINRVESEEILVGFSDVNGAPTWLTAGSDGGPTEIAKKHIKENSGGIRKTELETEELLFAFCDPGGVLTDLAITKEGYFTDATIRRIESRLSINTKNSAFSDTEKYACWGSSTFDWSHSLHQEMAEDLGFTQIFLGGQGGEGIEEIAARQGSVPVKVSVESGVIPTSGTIVLEVTGFGEFANRLKPYSGSFAGAHGALSYNSVGKCNFNRTAGPEILVDPTESFEFIPDSISFRNAVCLINAGKNNVTASYNNSPEFIFEMTKKMVEWCKPFYKFVIVVGNFCGTNDGELWNQRVLGSNALSKEYFGERFYDLQAYLTSKQIWKDTGITPTSQDLQQQSEGRKPSSLSLDSSHMNDAANRAYIKQLKEMIQLLGFCKNTGEN